MDECATVPCANGALCTDQIDGVQCSCLAGWAGDQCNENIDECGSSPCENGAGCTDSRSSTWANDVISFDAYSCECHAGFADGACPYDYIAEYATACNMNESSLLMQRPVDNVELKGNCAIDVDECSSAPCQNGAECTDSTQLSDCFQNSDGVWLCYRLERVVTATFFCGADQAACAELESPLGHSYYFVDGITTNDPDRDGGKHIEYPDDPSRFGQRESSGGLFRGVGVTLQQCQLAADASIEQGCDAFEYQPTD